MSANNIDSQDFRDAVRQELGPVVAGLGFEDLSASPNRVTFESAEAQLEVYCEDRSFEIGLCVVCRADPSTRFSMSELLRFWNHPDAERYRNYTATTAPMRLRGVQRLAGLIADLARLGMKFDRDACSGLAAQHKSIASARAEAIHRENLSNKVRLAWESRNFAEVVSLLTDAQMPLSDVELSQLQYARKHSRMK